MGFKINFNVALVQKVIQFQSGSDKDDGDQEKKDQKPAVEDNGEEKKNREKKREKAVVIIQGKALAKYLKRKLKKAVVFVQVNENGGGAGAGEEEKEREKNGAPVNSICPYGCPNPMGYPNMRPNGYGSGYLAATEQMFSDENPNACSVM